VNLEDCLPADLRPATITRIGVGQSGAGVYRVASHDATYVLKVATDAQPFDLWRGKVDAQRAAATQGVAPRIVHVDEAHRAVVSEHAADRGFVPLVMTPATRDAAIAQIGRTLRRLHDAPLPTTLTGMDARTGLTMIASWLTGFAVPAFASDMIAKMLAEPQPPTERAPVLSHNDVNPSNLAYDGERLLLLDWDASGPNDPLYDLATVAMFLRFDNAACAALIAAHDDAPPAELPARFFYLRRLVATMCGAMMLHLARQTGHTGSTDVTIEATPTMQDFYGRMRAGGVDMSKAEGRWQFGLTLLKAATTL
jgi:thiamine kinase-like enzyme